MDNETLKKLFAPKLRVTFFIYSLDSEGSSPTSISFLHVDFRS